MIKKLTLGILLTEILLNFGCTNTETQSEEILEETVYTAFIINTHDWVKAEESIETLNRIIDLHEEYQMPVDIYLDDPVIQVYLEQAPDLLERLKTSPYVAVSYHLRPPYPYYWDYDWYGLSELDTEELAELLLDYEEHEIDLITGEPTDNPGGYELLKDLMGYPPYVATVMGNPEIAQVLAEIYKEKGALFTLTHSGTTEWDESEYGLWMRPESLEVKVYEYKQRKSGEEYLTEALAELGTDLPAFLNLKWHENNFYTSGTTWDSVYRDGEDNMLYPPYDLSQAMSDVKVKTSAQKEEQWTRYEELLIYVKEHPETFTTINAEDLKEMFEAE
ncbi:MAG: hypothetical protein ACD_65C00345G0001 [uncultured bacterium]|nr:MAG: hypothetical protein ACD_65C00345G0001 [uncultured bacterium]KKT01813.1 MAG: hypothetical protein UV80_C0008G0023 [Candidatus Peregrinibacteria bacterium GW2011_GWF2_43_17]KKT18897.1 MAG: hypothetical protein UW03_C0028G0013 [Candidatus Peregrinibacteria bacterium GW2011_GWA2_43_8]HAU39491.1 hypothetical protein [Candidatus Peregrinibacteria bacterium]